MSARRPPAVGLTFAPGSHAYRLDGKPVPSVTQILGVINKPALPNWAARSVAEYVADHPDAIEHLYEMGRNSMVDALKGVPWKRRDDAATKGTDFHKLAERIANGEEVDVPEALVPLVENALDFMETWRIEPVLTEAACASREHWWAGTLDLVADSLHGPRAVFDWKSGKAIYASAAYQLNAYANAETYGLGGDEQPMADLGIEAAYGVHIRADGWDVLPLEFGPHVYSEFLHIRAVYEANKRAEGDWKRKGSGYVGLPITIEREQAAS